METSSIVLLVVSAAVSFGLGRAVVRWRSNERKKQLHLSAVQARFNAPTEPVSTNKSKRKRQISAAKRARF